MEVKGESQNQDLKLTFDPNSPKAMTELVKDLIAMANGGGGKIIIGCNETSTPGVGGDVVRALDSAKLTDAVERYIRPARLKIAHDCSLLDNGCFLYAIRVEAPEYPIVMSRKGDWKGMDNQKDKPVFLEGDILIRENSRTKRVTNEYLRDWIDRIRKRERENFLDLINKVVNVPDGADIQIVTPSDTPIDTPKRVLQNAVLRRRNNPNYLLNAQDLLEIFLNRHFLKLTEEEISLLIASALRRNSTLYWWLTRVEDAADLVMREAASCLTSRDRDKSDAGKSIVEMVAIFGQVDDFNRIVDLLRHSDYKHFREAAESWVDRETELQRIKARIDSAKHDGKFLNDFSLEELEALASEIAVKLSEKSNSSLSRKLSNVTRTIWAKQSSRFDQAQSMKEK